MECWVQMHSERWFYDHCFLTHHLATIGGHPGDFDFGQLSCHSNQAPLHLCEINILDDSRSLFNWRSQSWLFRNLARYLLDQKHSENTTVKKLEHKWRCGKHESFSHCLHAYLVCWIELTWLEGRIIWNLCISGVILGDPDFKSIYHSWAQMNTSVRKMGILQRPLSSGVVASSLVSLKCLLIIWICIYISFWFITAPPHVSVYI